MINDPREHITDVLESDADAREEYLEWQEEIEYLEAMEAAEAAHYEETFDPSEYEPSDEEADLYGHEDLYDGESYDWE